MVTMRTSRYLRYAGYRFPAEVIATAVRQRGLKFGREIAERLRRRAPRRGDKWHLDEVVLTIAGQKHYLWRVVDRDSFVLDVLVQSRRDAKAAKRLLRKLLKKQGWTSHVMVTDKLKSYAAAKRDVMPGVEHRQHKGLNNRAENSHQPTRRRDHHSATDYRAARTHAFATWAVAAGAPLAA